MPHKIEGKPKGASNLSLFCPEPLMSLLNKLVVEGKFQSRSEAVRIAIREFIQREFVFEDYFKEREVEAEEKIINNLISHKTNNVLLDGKEYTILREA